MRVFSAVTYKKKEMIAHELLQNENILRNDIYGRIVLNNCKIDQFKIKQESWKEKEVGYAKKNERCLEIF